MIRFLAGLVTLAAILAAGLLWRYIREASTPETPKACVRANLSCATHRSLWPSSSVGGCPVSRNVEPAPDDQGGWDDGLRVPVWLAQCGHRHQWGLACSVTAA